MVGDKTYQLLRGMGIQQIHTLQQMPCELMQQVLGDNGALIWRKANGIDNSPITPYSERKSISTERTFDKDTIDVKALRGILVGMTEKLAYQLRSEGKLTSCVTLKSATPILIPILCRHALRIRHLIMYSLKK